MISIHPQLSTLLSYQNLSHEEFMAVAWETFRSLGWVIIVIAKYKMIAYTDLHDDETVSHIEEITLYCREDHAILRSKSLQARLSDGGQNKDNINAFSKKFEEIVRTSDLEHLKIKFLEDSKYFLKNEQPPQKNFKDKAKDIFKSIIYAFIPQKTYFVTPIFAILNILIYILLAINSKEVWMMNVETLLKWGGNAKSLTLEGEWWRLLTSGFLHGGLLHIFFNVYVLCYIGYILEPVLGKLRFTATYLTSMIAGSLASVWWNDYGLSVGASGALFGMFGVFLALNSTEILNREESEKYFISIIVFIAINILFGMQEGIDNASHIGGLLGGLFAGVILYPTLSKPMIKWLHYANVGVLALIVTFGTIWAIYKIPNWSVKYEKAISKFLNNEELGMGYYRLSDFTDKNDRIKELEQVSIPRWQENEELMEDVLSENELPSSLRLRAARLQKYSQLRRRSFEVLKQAMQEEGKDYSQELIDIHSAIRDVMIELNPDDPSRYLERAKELKEKGDIKGALKDYEMAIALNPSNPYSSIERARIYYESGDYINAIVDYNRALELMPQDAELMMEAASCKEVAGLLHDAIHLYTEAIKISPKASPAYNGRAWAYHELGEDDKAMKDFEKALELNPSYAYAYHSIGLMKENQGNENEAIKYFKKSIEVDEKADYAYKSIARLLYSKKEYKKSYEAYTLAINADNLNADNYFSRARTALQLNAYDSMLLDMEEAIKLQPKRAIFYEFRAIAKEKAGIQKKSIQEDILKAIELDSTSESHSASNYSYHAGLFLDIKDLERAERDYRKAMQLDETYSTAFGNFGWLKYLKKEYDSCIYYSEKAILLDNTAFYAKYNLALSKLCLGKFEEAKTDYQKFRQQELTYRKRISEGALEDLRDLIKNGEKPEEAKRILKEVFGLKK
jgi:rhomboid protease GluP